MNVINELFTYYSSVITAKSTTKTTKCVSSKESELVANKNTCLVDEEDDEVYLDELYATTSNEKKVSELDLYMSKELVKVNDNEATFDVLS